MNQYQKKGTKMEKTYKEELQELRTFLRKKRKITDLATMTGVNRQTVHDSFNVESPDELTGKKINVIANARLLKEKIEKDLNFSNNTDGEPTIEPTV